MYLLRALVPAFALAAVAIAVSPSASAIPGYDACPPGGQYQLDVKGVGCEYAATVASAYEWEGDKYQDIYEYTCYSAQYDVRPIVLTCVSGDNEIVVSEI